MKRATELLYVWHSGYSISIHALVKRATLAAVQKALNHDNISIHALVKRATDNIVTAAVHMDISIHALVKRATPR